MPTVISTDALNALELKLESALLAAEFHRKEAARLHNMLHDLYTKPLGVPTTWYRIAHVNAREEEVPGGIYTKKVFEPNKAVIDMTPQYTWIPLYERDALSLSPL
jgi:hypothetical protein